MKRSIVASALLIAAATGVLAIGGTWAVFSDSQIASGDVNAAAAGSIDLRLDDVSLPCGLTGPTQDEITFEPLENLAPGGFATCSVQLVNQGTAPFDVNVLGANTSASILDVCDGAGNDFTISLAKGTDTDSDDPSLTTARVEPGVADTASITVTFNPAATNDCQGDVSFISVVFTASSFP